MTTAITVTALLAKCLVAAVFLSSGVAKLASPSTTTDRRLPTAVALLDQRVGRLGLGAVEVALGGASVLAIASPYVDAAILALCVAFLVGSAWLAAIRPGTACRCFGAASSSTFGARHTALTALLAVAAALVLVTAIDRSGDPAWSWHPLLLVTLAGLSLLAARTARRADSPLGRSS